MDSIRRNLFSSLLPSSSYTVTSQCLFNALAVTHNLSPYVTFPPHHHQTPRSLARSFFLSIFYWWEKEHVTQQPQHKYSPNCCCVDTLLKNNPLLACVCTYKTETRHSASRVICFVCLYMPKGAQSYSSHHPGTPRKESDNILHALLCTFSINQTNE